MESVFTVCPAPPGTDYINSISLAQPEYQHHRLDFTLPCLPESGPQTNIYTIFFFCFQKNDDGWECQIEASPVVLAN